MTCNFAKKSMTGGLIRAEGEPKRMIDAMMESFIAWHGAVPPDARRIDEAEAREYAASWVRRNLGEGIAHGYVIGYEKEASWWTLFFERTSVYQPYPEGAERWHVEAYDHNGRSWVGNYYFWAAESRWRHVFFATLGEDYGRAAGVRPRGDKDATAP